MFENKFIEILASIITTLLSIVKSDVLIERIGIEKFGLMIVVIIVITLIVLSDSPKEDR